MRINISIKMFFGFCVIILLNVFYVFIVYQLSDLNNIAGIVQCHDTMKNQVLKMISYQGDRRRSRTAFEAIGKPESIENFQNAGQDFWAGLDLVSDEINAVSNLATKVFKSVGYPASYLDNNRTLDSCIQECTKYSGLYEAAFKDFAVANVDSLKNKPDTSISEDTKKVIAGILDVADQKITQALTAISVKLDLQNDIVIKEIEYRINSVKQRTIIILSGTVVVALGFALFFSTVITRSLRTLKETAAIIGKGTFDIDTKGFSNDEIGDLANAFSLMAKDLAAAQEELVKSRRMAAIGEVVASVNHEINNPLMIISGNAQFLDMSLKNAEPDVRERVKTILEETDRISSVTKKLREIKNPVVEDYTSRGEQMINLDKSTPELTA